MTFVYFTVCFILQVTEACISNRCSSKTFRRLEADRFRTSAMIREYELTVTDAHQKMTQLREKTKSELLIQGLKVTALGAVTAGKIIMKFSWLFLF